MITAVALALIGEFQISALLVTQSERPVGIVHFMICCALAPPDLPLPFFDEIDCNFVAHCLILTINLT